MKKIEKINNNEVATKKDLAKGFEDLAGMISRGFERNEERFTAADERTTELDQRLTKQIEDFRVEVKNEFRQVHGILIENHEKRILALEKKTARI